MRIRAVTLDDIEQLVYLSRQTFSETFSAVNRAEDMADYLNNRLSARQLGTELVNPANHFYFAEWEGQAVGYLKLNDAHAQTELQDKKAIEIERIYVLNRYQGKGIGQQLLEFAIDFAHSAQANYLWLGVWEQNSKALDFYRKNGFVAFDKHIFRLGTDEQTDIMMKLVLRENKD